MNNKMGSALSYLNRLLPFATPGTPLLQDILHLAAICGALYFAPQLQEWYRGRAKTPQPEDIREVPDANSDVGQDVNDAVEAEQMDNPDEARQPESDNGSDDEEETDVDGQDRDQENIQPPAQPGPARDNDLPNQRNVGAKKAKALARRDQRRAYHEFQRAQGDAQRAADAEGAAEREAGLAKERERRQAAEAAVEAKKAKERETKKAAEQREWEEELQRRESAVRIVREELEGMRMSDLDRVARRVGTDVDAEWVERIATAAGLLGRRQDVTTMVTSTGWAVRVSADDMQSVYQQALNITGGGVDGKIDFEELGSMLEARLRQSVAT
ncbi:hypothetical protein LTR78_009082 [Recurvomyces mirabilis]|uniref:Uncharacterized protein n=1 Tax=Recurvomyces mirabilis TaxID=574656 RepID=A0AAE0TTY6_9PEZI|nr:hypothetical protein LTR78_009082 [Recurvomyces mirabilis]KAK5161020.1 hypothetical protein LTS14_000814 [Recurvomyces mirabilis]